MNQEDLILIHWKQLLKLIQPLQLRNSEGNLTLAIWLPITKWEYVGKCQSLETGLHITCQPNRKHHALPLLCTVAFPSFFECPFLKSPFWGLRSDSFATILSGNVFSHDGRPAQQLQVRLHPRKPFFCIYGGICRDYFIMNC